MEKDNLKTIHRPLGIFYYGSLAVIFLSLILGAYYYSFTFLKNEKNRAAISSLQLKESLNTEYRYIVEEFFTNSYDSVAIRVANALEKFNQPAYVLFLFNEDGLCVYAKDKNGVIDCQSRAKVKENFLSFETDLKLATNIIGRMRVDVENRFQFINGSLTSFALDIFLPIFLIVGILWISWVIFSRKKILIPYYKKMLSLEKDKASVDTIRQIIHDTKGEIASLDLLSYEIEDEEKAAELRTTLDKIRKAFDNLHQIKDSILPIKSDSLNLATKLFADLEKLQRIKYKHTQDLKLSFSYSSLQNERLKVDSSIFERVVSNLIENSMTATCNKEALNIEVVATNIHDKIFIEIKDNGEGIIESNLGKVFEKGFTTKSSGTGQGLCFVKSQVEEWGGKIKLESKVGIGTTVSIELPIAEKPKFVILDDDKYLIYRYKKMLERSGNDVEIYESGKELLNNAKRLSVESIFLIDYNLADGEIGTDVAQKLSKMGMKNLYLHTGNPMTDEMNYPYLKGVLSKGNFAETMNVLKI